MRIITGSAKGRQIKVPKSATIRPAKDMVRQAVFSMLQGLVEGARVLDLFAGSGAYGLEALSQGAARAVFVDADRLATETIRDNLIDFGFTDRGEVHRGEVKRFVARAEETFDLIFLDPPYEIGPQIHLLKSLAKLLAPQGVIIFDHAKETVIPEAIDGLKVLRERTYGITTVSILAVTA